MKTLLKIGLVAGAALALAACGSTIQPSASAPTPSESPSVVAPAPSASTPSASPPGSPPVASPSPKPPTASVNPCPVSEKTLLKVLNSQPGDDTQTDLVDIRCYRGYAYARQGPHPGPGERVYFLFGFTRPQNQWVLLNLGTGDVCRGYVLDKSVRDRLGEGC